MDTMGIVWLIIYGVILIVAIWKLKSSSAASRNNQKHNNDNACHVNGVSKLKQRFSGTIANSVSDAVDDNCGNDAKNCDSDNSYPHSTSIARDRVASQSQRTGG